MNVKDFHNFLVIYIRPFFFFFASFDSLVCIFVFTAEYFGLVCTYLRIIHTVNFITISYMYPWDEVLSRIIICYIDLICLSFTTPCYPKFTLVPTASWYVSLWVRLVLTISWPLITAIWPQRSLHSILTTYHSILLYRTLNPCLLFDLSFSIF